MGKYAYEAHYYCRRLRPPQKRRRIRHVRRWDLFPASALIDHILGMHLLFHICSFPLFLDCIAVFQKCIRVCSITCSLLNRFQYQRWQGLLLVKLCQFSNHQSPPTVTMIATASVQSINTVQHLKERNGSRGWHLGETPHSRWPHHGCVRLVHVATQHE